MPVWTRHVYSGIQVVAEYEACGLNEEAQPPAPETGWALARELIWGDRFPEPLAMIDWTNAGNVEAGESEILHYVHDPLGNVVGLADLGAPEATSDPVPGKLVERYAYDAYGKAYVEYWDPEAGTSGEWVRSADGVSRFGNPFMWTGQRYDAGVKLYYFLFRSYSPGLGRWMQRDPLGYMDDANLFEYAVSEPLTLTDPLGLDSGGSIEDQVDLEIGRLRDHREIGKMPVQ